MKKIPLFFLFVISLSCNETSSKRKSDELVKISELKSDDSASKEIIKENEKEEKKGSNKNSTHEELYSIVIFEEQSTYNPKDILVNITNVFKTPYDVDSFNEFSTKNEEIGKYFGTRQHGRIFNSVLKRFETLKEAEEYVIEFNKMLRLGGREPLSHDQITLDTIISYFPHK